MDWESSIIRILAQVDSPIALAAVGIGVLFLLSKTVLRLPVFSRLRQEQTYKLLVLIITYAFILALIALTINIVISLLRESPKRVLVMDSHFPQAVYDQTVWKEGLTNSSQITAILADLPVQVDSQLASKAWKNHEAIRQRKYDLIILHYSTFYDYSLDSSANPPSRESKLAPSQELISFFDYLANGKTQFLIYSRGFRNLNTGVEDPAQVTKMISELTIHHPEYSGTVHYFHVNVVAGESFSSPTVVAALKQRVRDILSLG